MHKYLNDIGIKSTDACIYNTCEVDEDRKERFEKEREEYGFDDRETWALNYTAIGWLYSHLKMFEEIGGEIVDLNFHKFDIPVLKEIPEEELDYKNQSYPERYHKVKIEEHTQLEAIHLMEEYLEYALLHDSPFEEELKGHEKAKCAFQIFAEILPAMWW